MQFRQILIPARGRNTYTGYTFNQGDATVINNGGGGGVGTNYWTLENNSMISTPYNVVGYEDVSAYGNGSFSGFSLSVIDNLNSTSTTDALSANQGRVLKEMIENISGGTASSVAWTNITGKPNSVAGYGITDAYTKSQVDTLLAGKSSTSHTHTFSSITDKPTTIAGYGITDAYTTAQTYTQSEVNNLLGYYLPLSGGTLTGDVNFNNTKAINLKDSGGTAINSVQLTSNSYLRIGYGLPVRTYIYSSGSTYFCNGSGRTTSVTIGQNGGFTVNRGGINVSGGSITVSNNYNFQIRNNPAEGETVDSISLLNLSTANTFSIGNGLANKGYPTRLYGSNITFYTESGGTSAARYYLTGSSFYPAGNSLHSIGTSSHYWNNLYISNVYAASGVTSSGDVSAYGSTTTPQWSLSVIDSLDSTSTTDALSANQGRVLKGLIDNLSGGTASSVPWSGITGKPTTIAGYGITDAYTKTQVDTSLAGKSNTGHTHTFASLTDKPTTVGGYGIGNAVTTNTAQSISGTKTFTQELTITNSVGVRGFIRNYTHTGSGLPILAKEQIGGVDAFLIGGYKPESNPSGLTYAALGLQSTIDNSNMLRIYPKYAAWGSNAFYHAGNANKTTIPWSASTLLSAGDVSAYGGASSPSWSLSVIDNLNSTSTTDALSAKQGKVLKEMIENISGGTASSVAWTNITNKPTTIAGYGITNAYTKTQVDTALAGKSNTGHTHTFASITNKPTTIAGYGITDAPSTATTVNLTGTQTVGGAKTFTSAVTVTSNLVAQCFVRNFNYTGTDSRAPIFLKGRINGTDAFIISGLKPPANPSGMTYVSMGIGTAGAPVGNDTNMLRIYPDSVRWGANAIYHQGNCNNSGTSWNCSILTASQDVYAYSDERLKTDIKDLELRGKLKPKTFIKDGKQSIGFIAQDVQELYPELVSPDENGMLRLNYQQVTAVLAAQINEHEEIIKKQETELANLKNEVNELKKIIKEKLK